MDMKLRRLLAALALSGTLILSQSAANAQEETVDGSTIGGSGDNVAVAISTKDGSSRFKVSFRIVRTTDDVIDSGNIAFAFASCEQCRSVAIAFQVVLVGGEPSTVIPENYAIALNFECIDCETLASAYQFVLGTDGNVHFSAEGNRVLSEIRRAIQSLASSDLPVEELQAELDLLAADLRQVLAEELVASGPEDVEVQEVVDQGEGSTPIAEEPTGTESPAPSPASEPTTSPSPPVGTESPSDPSPSPSPTVSPSSSPEPVPTVSATA